MLNKLKTFFSQPVNVIALVIPAMLCTTLLVVGHLITQQQAQSQSASYLRVVTQRDKAIGMIQVCEERLEYVSTKLGACGGALMQLMAECNGVGTEKLPNE